LKTIPATKAWRKAVTFKSNFKAHRRAAIGAVAAALLLGSGATVKAQPQPQSWIVGTWVLAAADKLLPDGTRTSDYGPNPHGLCIFTSDGYYSLQIYRTDRLKFASGEKFSGTPEEYKDVSLGMSVGFGRYSVDPVKHTITFHRDRNSVPNLDDTTGTNPYELNGDELSWKVTPRKDGSVPITVLRRAK
jgi:Lipocalin-like domain